MLLEHAIRLLEYGLTVQPLRPRSKRPLSKDWPRRRWSAAELRAHFARNPGANIGLICGASGWVAVDLDGDEWVEWGEKNLPTTPLRTVSGSGHGGHFIYRWPQGVPVPKTKIFVPGLPDSNLDKGVKHKGGDLYGDGTQIVLPPSIHDKTFLPYRWAFAGPLPPVESVPFFDLAWLPPPPVAAALPALPAGHVAVASRATPITRATAWIAKRPGSVEGQRGDEHAFKTACRLLEFGCTQQEAWQLLGDWNVTCVPPFGLKQLRDKLRSAVKHARPGGVPDRPLPPRRLAPPLRTDDADGPPPDDGHAADAPALEPPAPSTDPAIRWPVPVFDKTGEFKGPSRFHVENTRALLDAYGVKVRHNLLLHALEITLPTFTTEPEREANATLAALVHLAERRGLAEKQVVSHVQFLAPSYHPVLDWVDSRPWDGVDRKRAFFATVQPVPGSNVSLCSLLLTRWLVSCVRAVLPTVEGERRFTPQGVLVLQGPQGVGKSQWIQALAPRDKTWIAAGRVLDPHDRDSVQQATAFWIVELAELDATFRRADLAALKAFVTQDVDVYRSAYARREERTPRRTILAASVNKPNFLIDDTGNRRWWTVPVQSLDWKHDVDMQQLWAQVAVEARAGAPWWLDADEVAELAASNARHEVPDPLVEDLWETWELAPALMGARVTMAQVWAALPGSGGYARGRAETAKIASTLRLAGAWNPTPTHGVSTYSVRRRVRTATQDLTQDRRVLD